MAMLTQVECMDAFGIEEELQDPGKHTEIGRACPASKFQWLVHADEAPWISTNSMKNPTSAGRRERNPPTIQRVAIALAKAWAARKERRQDDNAIA